VKRQSYDGVVLAAPVSVPYVRYSQETAHWWIARALKQTLDLAGLSPRELDGFSVSSFTLFPDTPVGLTQHLGLSPRWLDSIPMGGASGVVALRRAARAVQAGDVDVVACIAGDANRIDSFRQLLSSFSRFAMDASYPYGSGGPNASFALIADAYMAEYGATREDFGRIAVAQRTNALAYPNAIMKSPLKLEQYLSARPISEPFGLFDCVMPCAGAEGFLVMREDEAQKPRPCLCPDRRPRSSATMPFPRIRSSCAAAGRWTSTSFTRWPVAGLKPSICWKPMTTIRSSR
jgi:acetyl-CoA acetyltransferase